MSGGAENPKLVHLVKKILRENPDWDAQKIVERLQTQYKEYQRKNAQTLQSSVQSILHNLDQPDDDPEYERAALLNDQQRGSGSLNESLRSRYQQQQQHHQQQHTPSEDKRKNGDPPESAKKRKKLRRLGSRSEATTDSFLSPRPRERYTDLGGMGHIVQEVRQLVEYPLVRPELYRHLGVEPPRGVLLRGPPGTGR